MIVLYPIKPVYVERILSGEKTFELRKRLPANEFNNVVIYSTTPVGLVVGYATVKTVHKSDVLELWNKVSKHAGIGKKDYLAYFENSKQACAIEFNEVYKFVRPFPINTLNMEISVPQSFCYVGLADFNKIKKRKAIRV
jgi:predicted transcriptional regulator